MKSSFPKTASPFRMLAHYNLLYQRDDSEDLNSMECARLYMLRGSACFHEAQFESALFYYSEAIKKDPQNILYHILYHQTEAQNLNQIPHLKVLNELKFYFLKKKSLGNRDETALLYYKLIKVLKLTLDKKIVTGDILFALIKTIFKRIFSLGSCSEYYYQKLVAFREIYFPPVLDKQAISNNLFHDLHI